MPEYKLIEAIKCIIKENQKDTTDLSIESAFDEMRKESDEIFDLLKNNKIKTTPAYFTAILLILGFINSSSKKAEEDKMLTLALLTIMSAFVADKIEETETKIIH